MNTIRYRDGYKYQLEDDYSVATRVIPPAAIELGWCALSADGVLTIRRNYAWDGPSGPTFDTGNFMRGSLIHDALYQLMREGCLPFDFRRAADDELYFACIEDGMSKLRAWWVYQGVRRFGAEHAAIAEKLIKEAP